MVKVFEGNLIYGSVLQTPVANLYFAHLLVISKEERKTHNDMLKATITYLPFRAKFKVFNSERKILNKLKKF